MYHTTQFMFLWIAIYNSSTVCGGSGVASSSSSATLPLAFS